MIGTIANERQARKFSAWLMAEGIDNQTELAQNQVQIWIKNEDLVDKSKQHLDQFLANPDSQIYQDAFERASKVEQQELARRKNYERNVVNARRMQQYRAPLTVTLIIISSMVALLTGFGSDKSSVWFESLTFTRIERKSLEEVPQADVEGFSRDNKYRFWSVRGGEVWRLVTPIFIHFGAAHLIFNMIWLFQLGRLIESREGTVFFGVLVIVSAMISNLIQVAVPVEWGGVQLGVNENFNAIAALGGMSGVVYAVFGFVLYKFLAVASPYYALPTFTIMLMLGWLVFCMTPAANSYIDTRNVANWAHGIGFVCGIAFGGLHTLFQQQRGKPRP
jgi:GlpG protein